VEESFLDEDEKEVLLLPHPKEQRFSRFLAAEEKRGSTEQNQEKRILFI